MLPLQLRLRVGFAEQDVPATQPRSVFDRPTSDEVRREAEVVCQYIELRMFS